MSLVICLGVLENLRGVLGGANLLEIPAAVIVHSSGESPIWLKPAQLITVDCMLCKYTQYSNCCLVGIPKRPAFLGFVQLADARGVCAHGSRLPRNASFPRGVLSSEAGKYNPLSPRQSMLKVVTLIIVSNCFFIVFSYFLFGWFCINMYSITALILWIGLSLVTQGNISY